MNKILGFTAAAVAGLALCGAASAGEGCGYRHCDSDWGYDESHDYRGDHFDCRVRLRAADCGDFRYRDWLPRRQTYVFWSPADHSWYYWCSASSCYYPYGQIDAHPPVGGVVPDMPRGLPGVVPGGVDKAAELPPVPPVDAPVGGATPIAPNGLPAVVPGGADMPPAPADGAPFRH